MPRKKLIEVALPLEAINEASAREKSIRHGHPSTLQLWWARRPLAAARAVIFASLVDDPDSDDALPAFVEACRALPYIGRNVHANGDTPRMRLFDFIEVLVKWESTTNEDVLNTARELINIATEGNPPPLLDPFAGGGSIPLEAQRLGLEAHASDLNPVAVMINKAQIEIPPRFANMPPVNPRDRAQMFAAGSPSPSTGRGTGGGVWKGAAGLAADVRYYGEWMREKAWERIGHLYPTHNGETVIAWLWARTVKSPNPAVDAHVPLVRSFILSKKKGKETWAKPIVEGNTVRFEVTSGTPPKGKDGTVVRTGATCIISGEPMPFDYVRAEGKAGRMGVMLMAIVTEGANGRNYYTPTSEHVAIAQSARPDWKPDHDLPINPRDFKTPNYGMRTFADLFTPRQLVALTTFSDLVGEAREQAYQDALAAGLPDDGLPLRDGGCGALAYSEAVSVYLAFAVDRSADRSSTICTWDSSPKMEALRNTFARQAIPMTWDFAEGNPFSESSGNWLNNVNWVSQTIVFLPSSMPSNVYQMDAAQLNNETNVKIISTDPPYCVVPGTLIYTLTGFKPIENIQVGDLVLTHQGRFAPVTKIYCRPYTGTLHQLKVAHNSQPLLITGEHPIYGIASGACEIGYADYCHIQCAWMKQNGGKCSVRTADNYELAWIPAGQVKRNDFIFMPTLIQRESEQPHTLRMLDYLPEQAYLEQENVLHYQKVTSRSLNRRQPASRQYQQSAEVPLTTELCRLIGYFVAEGYARVEHDGGAINFTFHADETALQEDVAYLMAFCFGLQSGKLTDNRERNNQSLRLNFYSKPVAQLLRAWCYTSDGHKQFPVWALGLSESNLRALVRGYWSGDGSRRDNEYIASTNSPAVAGQLRLMLQKLGIISRLHSRKTKPTSINGKPVIATGTQYSLHVTGPALVKLAEIVGTPKKGDLTLSRGGQHGAWWDEGYLLPIRKVDSIEYTGNVYNLETEDHSYTTAVGCVHNCDNIGYADLSDFFYVWLRRNLREVYPDIFGTMLVPKTTELVANRYRFDGSYDKARQFFEDGLHDVFERLCAIQERDYPTTVYYAYKQREEDNSGEDEDDAASADIVSSGWESVLNSLVQAGYSVNGTWPIRTELSNRTIASGTNALASSIVLVCRPRPEDAPTISRRQFVDALRRELPAALKEMQSGNIAPVDLAQASIGPGMAIYSRYSKVLEADGSPMSVRTALGLINQELDAYLAEQDGDIDPDTRFAVAWFEQFGFDQGEFGRADVLARAKNTSVDGVVRAGVVEAGRGKVKLKHWRDYDAGLWNPQEDKRPTVWEAVHHLIERLNTHGETGSALLITKMPPDMAAEARNLAYRLYSICERKGWAENARDYNALVISWAGIGEEAARLREAAQSGDATVQGRLFE